MAYEIYLPKLGANMTQGTIEEWFVQEGDEVQTGEPLFHLITDKATVEVEAENRGVLLKILVPAGVAVPIATVVGVIGEPGEEWQEIPITPEEGGSKANPGDRENGGSQPISSQKEKEDVGSQDDSAPKEKKDPTACSSSYETHPVYRVRTSPAIRMMAKEAGIDIEKILATGKGGIITVGDFLDYIRKNMVVSSPPAVIIMGAGEYSAVIREILEENQPRGETGEILGFADDRQELWGKEIEGIRVWGGAKVLKRFKGKGFVVSVGTPRIRRMLFEKGLNAGLIPVSAVHSRSCVSSSAVIAGGCVVEAFSVIAPRCRLERGVFVTQNCSVSHDCVLGEFSHLAPGCHLGGGVVVGRGTLIGVGCAVAPHVNIGDNTIITPGSSVDRDIPRDCVVSGVPGRIVGNRRESF